MTILVTGGTGKTSIPLAHLLSSRTAHTILLASRKGIIPEELSTREYARKVHGIKFDWFDCSSWENPFSYIRSSNDKLSFIDRIYLVAPPVWRVEFMNDFVDFARARGVNRFVLVSASQNVSGGTSAGRVHGYLEKLGMEQGVEWTVLRPTAFIENYGDYQLDWIRDHDCIPTVWEDGKVPLVSAEDIALAGFKGLISEPSPNTDWIIHGPELFSGDEVAALLTAILSRPITHRRITKEEFIRQFDELGLSELGRGLVEQELRIAQGSEEAIFKCAGAVVGKITLMEYLSKNKRLWMRNQVSGRNSRFLRRLAGPQ